MTTEQKEYVLRLRKTRGFPLHSLPHTVTERQYYHISASCYEHKPIIGKSIERMIEFEHKLMTIIDNLSSLMVCYVILPNHYHILIKTENIKGDLKKLFSLHQSTGFQWNKEDFCKGRHVWFNALDNGIKSERHYWATVNYIHNNPVKHEYVKKWQDWPFSSAEEFIRNEGYEKARFIWENYDISEMCKWDT